MPAGVKPSLLFISGNHRSGSTLLDMILGSHPGCCSVGEVNALREYFQDNRKCTCGDPIRLCPFWTGVEKEVSKIMGVADPCSRYKPVSRIRELVAGILRGDGSGVSLEFDGALIEAIGESTGGKVIVDSSKSATRLLYYMLWQRGRVVFVHLVRDPRAVINSQLRSRKYREDELLPLIAQWKRRQSSLARILSFMGEDRKILVRFEDLCVDPPAVLGRILSLAGLQYDESILGYWRFEHHNISGNIKTKASRGRPIALDEAWRRELPLGYATVIERRTRKFMEAYAYQ